MNANSAPARRLLVVVRHAHAVDVAASDEVRPLSPKGVRNAGSLGLQLAEMTLAPDIALVSAAVRTQQTWRLVQEAAGWSVPTDVSEPMYSVGVDSLLDLVHELPEEALCAVVVGHNPTVALLAHLLDSGDGDQNVSMRLATGGYGPGTATVFEFEGTWWDVAQGRGRLLHYAVGNAG